MMKLIVNTQGSKRIKREHKIYFKAFIKVWFIYDEYMNAANKERTDFDKQINAAIEREDFILAATIIAQAEITNG